MMPSVGDVAAIPLRREAAGDVFMELARRGGVDDGTASDWFDEWRDF